MHAIQGLLVAAKLMTQYGPKATEMSSLSERQNNWDDFFFFSPFQRKLRRHWQLDAKGVGSP